MTTTFQDLICAGIRAQEHPICTGREQDMRIALSVPQMNRLRYLVGRELGCFVPADRVPAYDGDRPYLIVTTEGFDPVAHGAPTHFRHPGSTYMPGDPGQRLSLFGSLLEMDEIPIEQVVRSASQEEFDEVKNLKDQLDTLWSGAKIGWEAR